MPSCTCNYDRSYDICNFCQEDIDDSYIWRLHVAHDCRGCDYCTDEERLDYMLEREEENRQLFASYMYDGFVEQYGPESVYNFMLVKNELLDYFEQKYNQQRAHEQVMAELVLRAAPIGDTGAIYLLPYLPPPTLTFPLQRHETYACAVCPPSSGCTTSNSKCTHS